MRLSKPLLAVLLTLLFGGISIIYFLQYHLLASSLYLLPPLLSVIAGIYAVRTFGLSNNTGKVFGLLSAGLICFFIGEVLFFSYQYIFHINPFPSIADIFYVAAYPLLFAGFMKAAFHHRVNWRNFSKLYLLMIVLLLVSLAGLVAYFGVYQAYSSSESVLSNTVSIAYGIGDLILIVPCLFLLKIILDFKGGKLFNSWVIILMALMFLLAGDLLFSIYHNSYSALIFPYTLIDLTFTANYLLFTYSFFYTSSTIKELGLRLKK